VRIAFEPRQLQNKQMKISIKDVFLWSFLLIVLGLQMSSNSKSNLVIIFYFTHFFSISLMLINEIDQIFVMCDVHTTCKGRFVLKACLFYPLAGG
jgi:hypothetical protein